VGKVLDSAGVIVSLIGDTPLDSENVSDDFVNHEIILT
jgi:hypothetical protein